MLLKQQIHRLITVIKTMNGYGLSDKINQKNFTHVSMAKFNEPIFNSTGRGLYYFL